MKKESQSPSRRWDTGHQTLHFWKLPSHCKSSHTDTKYLNYTRWPIWSQSWHSSKPWNVLTSPVWGAVHLSWLLNPIAPATPCALLDVPRSCIPLLPWNPPIPSSPPFPPDGNCSPAMHPLPVASLQLGTPLCRWSCPSPASLPTTLKKNK